ncbi:signal peptidase II [Nocardia cyriacigeorgica]|uniref:Lipoprotein signal peptidase n=1 Tax=Nocardia cyriacigeorgica TaxID=135487 RepID=A0A5R8NXN4_9NOCA|nr:signal peptidase II [Nocardia cyriacigeorgica]TLF81048.1 signal peptidase II [Nocardia cyriacigeorgica]
MMVGVSDDRPPEPSTAEQPPEGPARPPQRLRLLLVIAAVLFALDLLTKVIVVATLTPGDPVYLIGDVVRLSLVRNPGAAFSMATGMTWLLTLVAAAVVIGVIRIGRTLRSLWWAVGLGMVLGGALGNLVDRLFRSPGPLQGHVVDFVAVGWWPVFNVADSAIVCGAILLVVLTVFGFEPNGTRVGREKAASEAAETDPGNTENTVTTEKNDTIEKTDDAANTENTGAGEGSAA